MSKYILIDGIDLSGKSSVTKSFQEEWRQTLDKIPYQNWLYTIQELTRKNLVQRFNNTPINTAKCNTSLKIQQSLEVWSLLYFLKQIKEDLSYLHNEQFIQTIENINKSWAKPDQNTIQESMVSLRVMAYNHVIWRHDVNQRLLETLQKNPFDWAFILTANEDVRKKRAEIRQLKDNTTLTAMDKFVLQNPQAAKDMSDYIVQTAREHLWAIQIDTSDITIDQVIKTIKELIPKYKNDSN